MIVRFVYTTSGVQIVSEEENIHFLADLSDEAQLTLIDQHEKSLNMDDLELRTGEVYRDERVLNHDMRVVRQGHLWFESRSDSVDEDVEKSVAVRETFKTDEQHRITMRYTFWESSLGDEQEAIRSETTTTCTYNDGTIPREDQREPSKSFLTRTGDSQHARRSKRLVLQAPPIQIPPPPPEPKDGVRFVGLFTFGSSLLANFQIGSIKLFGTETRLGVTVIWNSATNLLSFEGYFNFGQETVSIKMASVQLSGDETQDSKNNGLILAQKVLFQKSIPILHFLFLQLEFKPKLSLTLALSLAFNNPQSPGRPSLRIGVNAMLVVSGSVALSTPCAAVFKLSLGVQVFGMLISHGVYMQITALHESRSILRSPRCVTVGHRRNGITLRVALTCEYCRGLMCATCKPCLAGLLSRLNARIALTQGVDNVWSTDCPVPPPPLKSPPPPPLPPLPPVSPPPPGLPLQLSPPPDRAFEPRDKPCERTTRHDLECSTTEDCALGGKGVSCETYQQKKLCVVYDCLERAPDASFTYSKRKTGEAAGMGVGIGLAAAFGGLALGLARNKRWPLRMWRRKMSHDALETATLTSTDLSSKSVKVHVNPLVELAGYEPCVREDVPSSRFTRSDTFVDPIVWQNMDTS